LFNRTAEIVRILAEALQLWNHQRCEISSLSQQRGKLRPLLRRQFAEYVFLVESVIHSVACIDDFQVADS